MKGALLCTSVALAACAPPAARRSPPVSVAVLVAGDEALSRRWPEALSGERIEGVLWRRAELAPSARDDQGAALADRAIAALALASTAFQQADFARCSHAFDHVSTDELLAHARRDLASRALLWQVACAVADERADDARAFAAQLATLELEVPTVVTRPDVEALIAAQIAATSAQPRRAVHVRSSAARTVIDVDGRPSVCRAPCELSLRPGAHVLHASADRFEPTSSVIRVRDDGATDVSLSLSAASAARASQQWARRDAREFDSAESVALLSVATASPRLAVIQVERERASTRLRAVLATDATVAARSERRASLAVRDGDGVALLRELLVRARVIEASRPVYESPWFWVGIGAAAVTGAAVTGWYFTRPVETSIGFERP